MRIAVSGHIDLHGRTAEAVTTAITRLLDELAPAPDDLVGLTCLAPGADTIFARVVLAHGGTLEAIVPATSYRDGLAEFGPDAVSVYDTLLAKAVKVQRLDHEESTSQAHMDASVAMVDDAEHLIAVWDGQPARGYGGTGDVVAYAREHGVPVTVVWPEGAHRGAEAQ
ncbi:hypothetical protein Afil01_44120 [Actinorhabdospora filicis]|uniref:Uncharacterized protein n=1 Tax=Actinorhabdospora filicis TaxID=1785913 RepID=A0A9W6SPG1_9ACTN|nr:hypothetical protein [Actinorhabdospora filicis]GLZ79605.1 hypothetical protein Afil01_44120 [Actinorhabdospora filicis]